MGKKKQKTTKDATGEAASVDAPAQAVANEPALAAQEGEWRQPVEAAEDLTYSGLRPRGGKWKNARRIDEATLSELTDRYLRALEDLGKAAGTCFSYRIELALAQRVLGADTLVSALTPERVKAFFECDAVTKTRTGVLKARVSVLKTQRVLRQALVWAERSSLVAKAPLPEPVAAT